MDLADITITDPPPHWTPAAVEADVDPCDATDLQDNPED